MQNEAIRADFLSADFSVRLPAPNGDPGSWWYWVTIGQNECGQWVANVKHKITGMDLPASVGVFPVSEITDSTAITLAKEIAAKTPAPPVKRRGRQWPEKSELNRSVWIVTLRGADAAGRERQVDVVITSGPVQEGLNQRPEPCTAEVRRRTAAGDAPSYIVPCNGMNPQHAGEAAVWACKYIRWT
jgi:hypothetical protein